MLRLGILVSLFAFVAAPAFAQGLYVSFAAGSDSLLVSHAEVEGFPQPEQGGTVPTLALRVGLPVGGRWGVELEGSHSLALERTVDPSRIFIPGASFTFSSGVFTEFPQQPTQILRPQPIGITLESERSTTAVNAVAWVRYTLGARLDLAFVGGATFARRTTEQRYSFQLPTLPPGFPPDIFPIIRPSSTTLVTYDVGPLAGAEAWLAFGDHIRLVPGVRLSALGGEWSVRPTAGVAWVF
jgi:hypothetical protein